MTHRDLKHCWDAFSFNNMRWNIKKLLHFQIHFLSIGREKKRPRAGGKEIYKRKIVMLAMFFFLLLFFLIKWVVWGLRCYCHTNIKKRQLWNVDPFLVVINMPCSLEQHHPCPVRIPFIGNRVAFFPLKPWSVFSDCVWTMIALLYAGLSGVLCACAHTRTVFSCVNVQQQRLYVTTRIICHVTPVTAHHAVITRTHDRSLLWLWQVWKISGWCRCVDGYETGRPSRTSTKCLLSVFSWDEFTAAVSPQRTTVHAH